MKEERKNGAQKACENFIPLAPTQVDDFRSSWLGFTVECAMKEIRELLVWCKTNKEI